jgi:ABC-type ATPase involved in cell division
VPRIDLIVETPVKQSTRVLQVEGQFDLQRASRREFQIHAELPIEDRPWQIGALIGPSGSGKSTIMRQLYGEPPVQEWDPDASILDGFPKSMTVQQVTAALSSVGFSTPPAWVRPFRTLSNGEQFRVSVARALCSDAAPIIIDEFTSVVDRTVAKVGAAAIAKHVRRDLPGSQLVIASCHEDVTDWLQPDWVYETGTQTFLWRQLQRRPRITLEVYRSTAEAWRYFAKYHYLSERPIPPSSFCLVGCIEGKPVCFASSLPQVGHKAMQRGSRVVVLPDYQGIGVGIILLSYSASLHKAMGYRWRGVASAPALVQAAAHSPLYHVDRMPSMKPAHAGRVKVGSSRRLTVSFEYVGPPASVAEARAFGLQRPPR